MIMALMSAPGPASHPLAPPAGVRRRPCARRRPPPAMPAKACYHTHMAHLVTLLHVV